MIRSTAGLYVTAIDGVNMVAKGVLGLLLLWMTIATFAQVLVRFVFTNFGLAVSAPWTEETARYAMIWIVFIGLGVGFRRGLLLSLTFIVDGVGDRLGQVFRYAALALSFGFLLAIGHFGLSFVEFGRIERSPALSLPKTWVYWALPVGAVLGCANIVALVADTWLQGADIRTTSLPDRRED
jgi:TRAP-type C4-dicarboxylate transport system permease small subunit